MVTVPQGKSERAGPMLNCAPSPFVALTWAESLSWAGSLMVMAPQGLHKLYVSSFPFLSKKSCEISDSTRK
jgi:hypothetical protein